MKSPERKQQQTPTDPKVAENLIRALSILKMNMAMYPAGHTLISQGLDSAYGLLRQIFAVSGRITIGVADETLFVDKETLEKENFNHRQFAKSLMDLSMTSITMSRGVTEDELLKFLRILTMKPSDIPASETVAKILAKNGIVHIEATYLTLDYFRFTEDRKGDRADTDGAVKSEDKAWMNYIASLVQKDADKRDPKSHPAKLAGIASADFAGALNTRQIGWDVFLDDYGGMITKHLAPGDEEEGAATRHAISRINELLKDLHPRLKQQLLSMVEKKIAALPLSSITLGKLECFSYEMITQVLRSASEKKKEMSPSLVLLFQKMSNIGDRVSEGRGDASGKAPRISRDASLSADELEKLIRREKYESYVPSDYRELLAQKAGVGVAEEEAYTETFALKEHLKTLEDARVDIQVHWLLLALMDGDLKKDDYHYFSLKIAKTVPDFLLLGHFPFLIDLIETLRRHVTEKPSKAMQAFAGAALAVFNDAGLLSRSIRPFILQGISIPALTDFIEVCGSQNVPWLLDLYLETESPRGQAIIVELMRHFSQEAINKIQNRLPKARPYHIRKLFVLLQMIGDAGVLPFILEFADHPDADVRLDVISALLWFNDPQAKIALQKAVASQDSYETSQAIMLACRKRVMDFVATLIPKIKTFFISEKDLALNELIIAEIAKTGDSYLLRQLEKLAGRRLTLFPGRLTLTKETLYKSLLLNPTQCSVQFVRAGLESKDERIRELCMEMMKAR